MKRAIFIINICFVSRGKPGNDAHPLSFSRPPVFTLVQDSVGRTEEGTDDDVSTDDALRTRHRIRSEFVFDRYDSDTAVDTGKFDSVERPNVQD